MTTHAEFYANVATEAHLLPRLRAFLSAYAGYRDAHPGSLDVLDVGCGEHALLSGHLSAEDRYHGVDVKPRLKVSIERYRSLDLNCDDLASAWDGSRFDVIFCGEVLEHVFSPDRLLRQVACVMHRDSLLILSTPNLAYWPNRLLLMAGFSPLFLENSAEVQLGRRFALLGNGGPTQGHVRLFTHDAARELFRREGFELQATKAVPVWGNPVDRFICRFSHRLAPVNVYLLARPTGADRARAQPSLP